jgi:hypothetical protein
MREGIDTASIAAAIGEERPWPINEIEVRYRQVGDDELITRLAEFYDIPAEELFWHRERSRKDFTFFFVQALNEDRSVALHLRSGTTLVGKPQWWDLGAVGLLRDGDEQLTVVQRHAVVDWDFND